MGRAVPICRTRSSVYLLWTPWSYSFGNKPHVCLSEMERVRKWDEVVELVGTREGIDSGLQAGCQGSMAAITTFGKHCRSQHWGQLSQFSATTG